MANALQTQTAYATLCNQLRQQPKKWLITGVAGFIGSHLLRQLLALQQIVIGLDNFSTGYQKNLEDVAKLYPSEFAQNFTLYTGDICDFSDCAKAVAGVDYVLHQAALGSIPRSIQFPDKTHAANATGFLNMLHVAKDAGIKRFVYASSSAVYGDSQTLPKQEEHIGKPLSPYAASKYTNELYAAAFNNCYQLETIGLRYFNVFGVNQDAESAYAAVIPQWIKGIQSNEAIYIFGDGETSRDFCYIDNVVQANLLAATVTDSAAVNTVYNIAVGERNTLNQLYDYIVQALDCPSYDKMQYADFRQGDIRHSLANIDKAKQLLGYAPQYGLADGLKLMLGKTNELSGTSVS